MTSSHPTPTELESLLDAMCEDRLAAADVPRLEQMVLSSPEAMWKYLTYLDLHGTLYWDAAGAGSSEPLSSQEIPVYQAPEPVVTPAVEVVSPRRSTSTKRLAPWIGAVAACLILVVAAVWQTSKPAGDQVVNREHPIPQNSNHEIVIDPNRLPPGPVIPSTDHLESANNIVANHSTVNSAKPVRSSQARTYGPPIDLPEQQTANIATQDQGANPGGVASVPVAAKPSIPPISSREVVARINSEIQSQWKELGYHPSRRSDDAEWMRRVYLDLIGRVPTVPEAESFLADKHDQRRENLVEHLLDDSAYVRNFTTKWANLLIGRSSNPQVDRDAFQKFLRLSFAANRPWNQIVAELISAEGTNHDNGATNFLIAHLNNDATPATAVASKLFLGRQVQCNQCHNNPFDETKQLAFWELNSFFQQTASVSRQRRDANTGRSLYAYTELVTQDVGGPTYFETQTGLMRVAYPRYDSHDVDASPDTNRRRELARLMTQGDQPQLAAAFINRMWDHFFGSGFTRSVDDMGAHQPTSHPELLAALSEQFVRSGYDIKQLIRWICQSDAYHLSSKFSDTNQNDDPSYGELPAFSRMYVKSMTAEQTYDSFLAATKAHQVGAVDWTQAERNRQQWLQQFVVAFHTDENDETMAFEGTVGNALSLMNGPLIDKALDTSSGSFLGEVVRQKSNDGDKIRLLCLATLSRVPSASELSTMKRLIRDASHSRGGQPHSPEAFQDLFWALLNSNEFVLIH